MVTSSSSVGLNILLVEDNPADLRLLESLFQDHAGHHRIKTATDGEKAIDYLTANSNNRLTRPDLVVLDLNLPRMDGKQVLRKIRSENALHSIPVVILTTSSHETDINECYALGANSYLTKPDDLPGMLALFQAFRSFWLQEARLPIVQ
jgi:CheY-like chemotaxis protein